MTGSAGGPRHALKTREPKRAERGRQLTLFRERSPDRRQAEQSGRLNMLDNLLQRLELRRVRLGAGEVALVLGKVVAAVVRDETLFSGSPPSYQCLCSVAPSTLTKRLAEKGSPSSRRARTWTWPPPCSYPGVQSASQSSRRRPVDPDHPKKSSSKGEQPGDDDRSTTRTQQLTTPDEPAPKKRIFWSLSGTPFRWKARIAPARTTAPVPWMSSTDGKGRLSGRRAHSGRSGEEELTVEAGVHVAVLLQERESERGVEVFELDDLRGYCRTRSSQFTLFSP